MKIKSGFLLREVAGSFVVVAIEDKAKEFNGLINLNETGAFIWKQLEKDTDENAVVAALLREYDVTEEVARQSVNEFVTKLRDTKLIDE